MLNSILNTCIVRFRFFSWLKTVKQLNSIALPFIFLLTLNGYAQPMIWSAQISHTNINLFGSPVILSQVTVEIPSAGKVEVRFDGQCIADYGDGIVLAASDHADWEVNDGNIFLEVKDNDVNDRSFSHTRVYSVSPGTKTFYAVGENYVETDGSGKASIYGTLTVIFFPDEEDGFVESTGINYSGNVYGAPVTIGQLTVAIPLSGKVIVHFDGKCISNPGDRIVLAASNIPDWGVNDGNVGVEAFNSDINYNPFSHSREYDVSAGNYTYYAVAENFLETDGNGNVFIYGTLTVEFFPDKQMALASFQSISETNVDFTNVKTLAQLTVNVPVSGKIMVHFDGSCISAEGDLIVLAASNVPDWEVNDGNVSLEAMDNDVNQNSFSHTRIYPVLAGNNTFYAVGQNYVEYEGSGIASVYGSLTAEFFPNAVSTCNIPAVLSTGNITPTSVKLQWDAVSGAMGYKVRYKIAGTPEWTKPQSIDNDKIINGLVSNAEYVWQVKSICGVYPIVSSDWSEKQFFTTEALRLEIVDKVTFEVYPNPASQLATVSFYLNEESPVMIEVMDVNGRFLKMIVNDNFSPGNYEVALNCEPLHAGIYFLQMKTNEGVMLRKVVLL